MQPTASDKGQDTVLPNDIGHKEQSYKLYEKKRFKNGGRAIMARLQLNKSIQEVWIYEKGKLRLLLKDGLFIKKQRGV